MTSASSAVCVCGPEAVRGTGTLCSRCGKPLPVRGGTDSSASGDPAPAPSKTPTSPVAGTSPLLGANPELGFEQIVIRKGWATLGQVENARRKQEEELAKGRKFRIGEALVELKILTPEQVKEALLLQDKTPMRCLPCGKSFNVRGLKSGSKALCPVCKAPLVPPSSGAALHVDDTAGNVAHVPVGEAIDPSLVDLVPGYRIERRLGSGGMGEVYLARQKSLDRLVAIKILSRALSSDPAYVARFLSEARSAGRLSHENVVSSVDSGESKGSHYFIMEYVQGETLQALLEREKALPERRALEIARQVGNGLWHASQQSLIHRDIKPANIMITPAGVAKICDFGLARDLHSDIRLTQSGFVHSSPAYASPEQCKAQSTLDQRSDMYSLGVTLFEMLTGELPFKGEAPSALFVQHATKPPPHPRSIRPTLSPAADQLVLRLLRKEPERRFKDYGEFLVAITEALHTGKAKGLEPAATPQKVAIPRKNLVLMGGIASTVLVIGLVFAFMGRRGKAPESSPPPAAGGQDESAQVTKLFAEARQLEQSAAGKPSEYPAVLANWKSLALRFRRTPQAERFSLALVQFEARVNEESEAAAQELLARSRVWEETGTLGESFSALGRFPKGFEGTPGALRISEKSATLSRALDERYQQGWTAAITALSSEHFDDAKAQLDLLRRVVSIEGTAGLEPVKPIYREELDALAKRIENDRQAARMRELELAKSKAPGGVPSPPPSQAKVPLPLPAPAPEPAKLFLPSARPRLFVPAPAVLKESEKSVREIFKEEYGRKAAADRQTLAKKMIALAGDTKDDPAGKYVLLREARDLFAGAGNMPAAVDAVDKLAAEFEVDVRQQRQEIYLSSSQGYRSPEDTKTLGALMLRGADEALAADDTEGASRLAAAVAAMAKKAKDVSLTARAEAKGREVAESTGRREKFEKALELLSKNPASSADALVAGRYYCGVKEDWKSGLPLLAMGTEAPLKELAQRDLAIPPDARQRVLLADDWWDASEKEQGATRESFRKRAAYWYAASGSDLAGFSKVKADRRTAEARAAK